MCCTAHLLNLIVQDGLKTIKSDGTILESVKFIRNSQSRKRSCSFQFSAKLCAAQVDMEVAGDPGGGFPELNDNQIVPRGPPQPVSMTDAVSGRRCVGTRF
jgi:hypothetical protein